MNRRNALIGFGMVGAALVIPGVLGRCSPSTTLAMKPWSGPLDGEHDARLRALSYAVLAPNAHNTQPWSIALRGKDELVLYVDRARLLPETDPPFRQTHVSQGTFLELLVVALSSMNYGANVTLFPEGEYSSTTVEDRPVASVRIVPGAAEPDPLFLHIPGRRSNKRPYDPARPLTRAQVAAILRCTSSDAALAVVEDPAARERLARVCADGMVQEVKAPARNVETAKWFRFSSSELEAKRDGFSLENNGKTGFTRWFAEQFLLRRERSADPGGLFASGAVDTAREQAGSSPAFGVLTTQANMRKNQVQAGRTYARAALTVEALGLSMHPMSQSLEEYADMAGVKARMEREVGLPAGSTVQMLFRLGHADATPHTPRRDVRDMVRRS